MKRKHFWQNSWIQLYFLLMLLDVVIRPTEAMQEQTLMENIGISSIRCALLLLVVRGISQTRKKSKLAKQKAIQERDQKLQELKEKEQYLKNKKPSGDPITTCRGCGAPMPVNDAKCPYCGLDNPHYSKY